VIGAAVYQMRLSLNRHKFNQTLKFYREVWGKEQGTSSRVDLAAVGELMTKLIETLDETRRCPRSRPCRLLLLPCRRRAISSADLRSNIKKLKREIASGGNPL
jgi:hypothetical protein